ncbi:uncharacterized protein LOC126718524 isoform X1 [Quercus robur]|uniref:uncharacterized protein LOC126718524 isoform X1 n=1 Tax=Quercus robur TaxID=38942 RepID=UPI002161B56F|nr:uncharacterized protein LOC126718524 isoform X1 [Quercus robur]
MAKGLIQATAEDLARNRGQVLSLYRQIFRSINSPKLPLTFAARLAKKAEGQLLCWSKSYLEGSRYGRACILWCEDNTGELICIQCQRLRFLHKMRCKEYVSMKKIEILLLINLIMERFLKVALELLKQFFIAIMKLESSFIKFLLNQATIWRNKFPELVTG